MTKVLHSPDFRTVHFCSDMDFQSANIVSTPAKQLTGKKGQQGRLRVDRSLNAGSQQFSARRYLRKG